MNNTLLNYCTHAIEEFNHKIATTFKYEFDPHMSKDLKHNYDYFAAYFGLLCKLLNDAVKFTLPDNGRLISSTEDEAVITSKELELLMLPYPIIALEFTGSKLNDRLMEGKEVSEKRVSLAFNFGKLKQEYQCEMIRLMPSISLHEERYSDMTGVISVFHTNERGWEASVGCCFIGSDSPFETSYGEDNKPYTIVGSEPAPLNIATQDAGQIEELFQSLSADTADESIAVVEFCAIMNCVNVETQILKPSDKLNKKRKLAGKLPFYEYHVLMLNPGVEKIGGNGKNGSHASPRMHLRRGHIRRLSNSRVTWVNAAIVGNKKDGVVEKSYSLNK